MLIKRASDIRSSEITPESAYRSRREFLQTAAAGAIGAYAGASLVGKGFGDVLSAQAMLANVKKSPLSTTEPPHTWEQITEYNNFYEFGTNKSDPARNAGQLHVKPWTVKVDGLVAKPADYAFDDLIKPHQLEERIYRFRCVEAWSAVIPWVGIPLADVLKRMQPQGKAAFVARSEVYSSCAAIRRSRIPVRLTIQSSVVSTIFSRSALQRMRSGT